MFGGNKNNGTQGEEKTYIDDRPINSLSEDRFQFGQVAALLNDLIETAHTPMHIGLFGGWGTGKTSILRLLDEIITSKPNNRKQEMKIVSVWKFADDAPSLHRKIVREVEAVLGEQNDEGLDHNTEIQDGFSGTGIAQAIMTLCNRRYWTKENKAQRLQVSVYFFLLVFLEFIVIYLPMNHPRILSFINRQTFLGVLFLIVYILFNKSTFQSTQQKTTKPVGLQHGDQYERRFEVAVDSYLRKKGNGDKKLILVFDDLDRLPPRQLVAALNTITTFLYSKKCIFIIPCDENVLREGIRNVFQQQGVSEVDASEFLNKTFDYQIHVPAVEPVNMRRYAKQLVKSKKVSWAEDDKFPVDRVLGILIHTGVTTPRQVKALLNGFAEDWTLARQRDASAGLKFLTQRPTIIAIFTTLKTSFPMYYSKLTSQPFVLLDDVTRIKEPEQSLSPSQVTGVFADVGGDNLLAFLSRVASELPDDPRHFIYFSNNQLNPLAGRPDLARTVNHMFDKRVTEFMDTFAELEDDEKKSVFEVALLDIEDITSIEAQNILRVLLEAPAALSYRSEDDYLRWDELVTSNMEVLQEYPPDVVFVGLDNLTFSDGAWHGYGTVLDIKTYRHEILEMWITNPSYIGRMRIADLDLRLQQAFEEANESYALGSVIFTLNENDSMLSEVDWLEIMARAVTHEDIPGFTFSNWLRDWSQKTHRSLGWEEIDKLLAAFRYHSNEPLVGIGDLWLSVYQSDEETEWLGSLFHLLGPRSFPGFTETNLKNLNQVLSGQRDYGKTRDTVRELLDRLWEEDEEAVCNLISYWPDSPGVPGFCAENLRFDYDDDRLRLFGEVITNKANRLTKMADDILEKVRVDVEAAATQGRSTQAMLVLKLFVHSETWSLKVPKVARQWLPISDPYAWLGWPDPVLRDRLEICALYFRDDEEVRAWFLTGIQSLVAVLVNAVNPNKQYRGNCSAYLSLIVKCVVQNFNLIDWNSAVESWSAIPVPGRGTLSLLQYLDVGTVDIVLEELTRRCNLDNSTINGWLKERRSFGNTAHQEALVTRWGYLAPDDREVVINALSNTDVGHIEEFMTKLTQEVKRQPKSIYIDEIDKFQIGDKYKQHLCHSVIDGLQTNTLNEWIGSSLRTINQNGLRHWYVEGLNRAILSRHDIRIADYSVIRTSLGLTDERCHLALKLILAARQVNTHEVKSMREAILNVEAAYPQLVAEIKRRFGIRKSPRFMRQ